MKLISEQGAAQILGCSLAKMQKDRQIGSPIPFVKIGRSVKYKESDVLEYIERQSFSSTSEYDGGDNA